VLGSNMVPDIRCDVASWTLFGLSLAFYNALVSFGTGFIAVLLLWRSK
jgi:disulfide bond formation protein DsbB